MDNATQDYSNQPTATKKSKLPIIIIAVVLIAALSAGAILFSQNKSSKPPEVAGSATVAPTPSPTPTPPTVDKASVKIQVLNGTGTPGQATKVAVSLKNAGYNLDNIKTGNAPDNLTTASIAAKAGFESTAADIKTALSSDFPGIDVSSAPLATDSAFDIVVTTGGKAYVVPTTPTPTGSVTTTPTPTGTSDTPTPTPTTTNTPTPTPTP